MKTVTLIACDRPDYLRKTLEALRENNLEGYTLYVGCEPVDRLVISIIKRIDFMPVKWWVNPYRMGINKNAFNTLSRAFDEGSQVNVYLEDDIILSPDALDLANWYLELADKHNHLGLGLTGPWSNPAWPNVVHSVVPSMTAMGAGFVATAWQWQSIWRRHWFAENAPGWDKNMEIHAEREKLVVLRPRLVRSTSIGVWGMSHHGQNDEFFESNPISHLKGTQFIWRD